MKLKRESKSRRRSNKPRASLWKCQAEGQRLLVVGSGRPSRVPQPRAFWKLGARASGLGSRGDLLPGGHGPPARRAPLWRRETAGSQGLLLRALTPARGC